jgi:CPA2 family monovalent cation:H+ antiporter-2
MVMSESDYSYQALGDITPLRDLFGLLFFVSVGMLLNPAFLWTHLGTVALVVSLVTVGKGLICGGLTRLFGYGNIVPFAVGLGLFQIGEFSFVLARVGLQTGALAPDFYALVLSTALVTMVLTPIAAWGAEPLYRLSTRWRRRGPLQSITIPQEGFQEHVVIAGGGRVGQYVATVLQRLSLPFVVIELDQRRVEQCRDAAMPVIYGDASHGVVLDAAAVRQARLMILTVPPIAAARAIVAQMRQRAPGVPIVARAEGVAQMHELHDLGVAEVVQPEFEAGLELVRQALLPLDVPATEIEHYADAVRAELYAPLYQTHTGAQPLLHLRGAFHRLALTWVPVADASGLVGRTLHELDIRRQTGASVVAVLREGTVLLNPEPTVTFIAGDLVGVLGQTAQCRAFQQLAQPHAEESPDVP